MRKIHSVKCQRRQWVSHSAVCLALTAPCTQLKTYPLVGRWSRPYVHRVRLGQESVVGPRVNQRRLFSVPETTCCSNSPYLNTIVNMKLNFRRDHVNFLKPILYDSWYCHVCLLAAILPFIILPRRQHADRPISFTLWSMGFFTPQRGGGRQFALINVQFGMGSHPRQILQMGPSFNIHIYQCYSPRIRQNLEFGS